LLPFFSRLPFHEARYLLSARFFQRIFLKVSVDQFSQNICLTNAPSFDIGNIESVSPERELNGMRGRKKTKEQLTEELMGLKRRADGFEPLEKGRKQWDNEEAAERLAAIVQSSDDAIIGKTLEGIILSWNSGAERIYGYTSAQIVGRPTSILLPPERPDEVSEFFKRIKRGEHIDHYETIRVRKNGQVIMFP
jgi:PAS domain S-box-containing protein